METNRIWDLWLFKTYVGYQLDRILKLLNTTRKDSTIINIRTILNTPCGYIKAKLCALKYMVRSTLSNSILLNCYAERLLKWKCAFYIGVHSKVAYFNGCRICETLLCEIHIWFDYRAFWVIFHSRLVIYVSTDNFILLT